MASNGNWLNTVREGLNKIDADMEFLLNCLQEVFEDLGEKPLADLISLKEGQFPNGGLPDRGAQAISIVFQLLNLVEENAAQQAIRRRETDGGNSVESGLWSGYLEVCHKDKLTAKQIVNRIKSQSIEAVLTGHPTEAKRWTVLDQHRELYTNLVELENQMYTQTERDRIRNEIKAVLEHLWRTGEILMTKPDLKSERLNALYYLRERFPVVLKSLDYRFNQAWKNSSYDKKYKLKDDDFPNLRFGSWVGGDRDGHPLVTAEVTQETLEEMRTTAFLVINHRLKGLEKRFGLSIYGQNVPMILTDRIKKMRKDLGSNCEEYVEKVLEEPWRQFLRLMRCHLKLPKYEGMNFHYNSPSEILEDLEIFEISLREVKADRLIESDVFPLKRIISTFGFHLASLDIRQNSAFHDKAISQLMDAAGLDGKSFINGSEEERLDFLNKELETIRPFVHSVDDLGNEAKAVVQAYTVISKHIENYGRAGIGALIVSMTRSLSDLLVVYLLCRETGLLKKGIDGNYCLLPVVPLFETIDDLERSPSIMDSFLSHPITQRSLSYLNRSLDEFVSDPDFEKIKEKAHRKGVAKVQQIMLGYSDSNKDSGILASQWALQEAQLKLLKVASNHGAEFQFFHGRGGTVSRGAGPTHRFLEALPEGSLKTGLRVTEQGETIAQKYTNRKTATYNLELLTAGSTCVSLNRQDRAGSKELQEAMAFLADTSRTKYRGFLHDPDFITFYRQATPIDVLEISRIGSRPSRRSGLQSLDDLRAIPWVFSWTQARFYFPGWYGVGTALSSLKKQHPSLYKKLKSDYATWPFLRYVLFNVESGLASAKPDLMSSYAGLVKKKAIRERLGNDILNEYALTVKEMNSILGGDLSIRRPRFTKTLKDREAGLEVLHREQIRLLKKWRSAKNKKEAAQLVPSLLLTVNAIASGLRTTG